MLSQMVLTVLQYNVLFVNIFEGNLLGLSLSHRVKSIIVSNSCVVCLSDTVTGVDEASHHAP